MAQQQNYNHHIRFYTPHHFVFYPIMLALLAGTIAMAVVYEKERLIWVAFAVVISVITWLSYMLRQHYALTLQNRLVLLELRYRYFVVTGKHPEAMESRLNEGQLFALRFASDGELEKLTIKAIEDNLSPDSIKKAIKLWHADHRRV